jgi:hypothetical protein
MHREQVCRSPWIQCDDTTLDVQDPSRAQEIRTGHLWVYRGELGEVVYDFTWSRNRDGPLKMLAHYRGYLQVDAAPAYDDVFTCKTRYSTFRTVLDQIGAHGLNTVTWRWASPSSPRLRRAASRFQGWTAPPCQVRDGTYAVAS